MGSHVSQLLDNKGISYRHFEGDVTSSADWEGQLGNVDIVLHMANVKTDSDRDFEVNTGGTIKLYEALGQTGAKLARVVLVSSQSVYLGCEGLPYREDMKPVPTIVYAKSRLEAEEVAKEWGDKLGIHLVVLRPSVAIGPQIDERGRISAPLIPWTRACLEGGVIKVFQDGNQTRDYTHVKDIAEAIVMAIDRLRDGVYNISSGEEVRLIEVAQWIIEDTNTNTQIVIAGGEPTLSDPSRVVSDATKIKKSGWQPERTARQAVREFVEVYSVASENE